MAEKSKRKRDEVKPSSARGRQAGDYSPPILVQPKGGPIPEWSAEAAVETSPSADV